MNKVNWETPGGRPRDFNQPFQFMQEAFEEAINGALSFLGTGPGIGPEDGVKISGCTVDTPAAATPANPNTADIVEGFVWIDGEVYHVEEALSVTKNSGEDWVIKVTDLPSGIVLPYATGPEDVMRVRKAVLVGEPSATSGDFMPYDAKRFEEAVIGSWNTRAFDANHYVTNSTPTWSVNSNNVYWTHRLNRNAKTLDVSLRINTSSLSAAAAELRVKIYGIEGHNLASLMDMSTICRVGTDLCYVSVDKPVNPDPGSEFLHIRKVDGTDFSGTLGRLDLSMTLAVYKV